ncbi:hypothetical protein Daesc_004634 [Daldinia eschscholtzii]|uniref:Uncharacterized protein n=1 Tax=Daldinia eschscholtzii TaxID=292717 RepID=A0AAX6MQI7_9PEZI
MLTKRQKDIRWELSRIRHDLKGAEREIIERKEMIDQEPDANRRKFMRGILRELCEWEKDSKQKVKDLEKEFDEIAMAMMLLRE